MAQMTAEGDPPPPPPKVAFEAPANAPTVISGGEDKLLADALGVPSYSFAMPANVYGTAAMCAVIYEPKSFGEWWSMVGESYLRCAVNVTVQVGLMLAVYQIDVWQLDNIDNGNKDGSSCYRLTPFFFALNLWIFCSVVLTELFETFGMYEIILRHIPTVSGHTQPLRYKTGDGDPVLQSGGMSVARKACLCIFVLGTKLALGVAMLIVGGGFLKNSGSNTDLLLNSLAAVFILDMDEIIYSFMTPGVTRRLLESLPSFDAEPSLAVDFLRKTSFLWKTVLSALLVAMMHATANHCNNNPCDGAIRTCPAIDLPGFRTS